MCQARLQSDNLVQASLSAFNDFEQRLIFGALPLVADEDGHHQYLGNLNFAQISALDGDFLPADTEETSHTALLDLNLHLVNQICLRSTTGSRLHYSASSVTPFTRFSQCPISRPAPAVTAATIFYVLRIGRVPGIHISRMEVQRQTTGVYNDVQIFSSRNKE